MSGKRPWLAVVLAFVYPGLGHVYLREWARALLWFGLVVAATSVLVPESAVPAALSVESVVRASRTLPVGTAFALVGLMSLNMADAYLLAVRAAGGRGPASDSGQDAAVATRDCPDCGRELDADLEFCHWCTAELGGEEPTSR